MKTNVLEDQLLALAIHDPVAAKFVHDITPEAFTTEETRTVAGAISFYHGKGEVTGAAFRTYITTRLADVSPMQKAGCVATFNRLQLEGVAVQKKNLLPVLKIAFEEQRKFTEAKRLLRVDPIGGVRALRRAGYDSERLDELLKAVAAKSGTTNAAELIAAANVVKSEALIDGVLRRGETLNVVAAPKARKSWLVMDLATSLEHGTPWLGRSTVQSRVLLLDNELHAGTLKDRLSSIYAAKNLAPTAELQIRLLRGRQRSIDDLQEEIAGGSYDVIILDALYRFFPAKFDENSNADFTRLYNDLDEVASATGAAIILVHHSSKGSQAGKSVTDVGSGAGAQSRAADAHCTIRPVKSDGDTAQEQLAYLDVANRSFPPVGRIELRWDCPLWRVHGGAGSYDYDPTNPLDVQIDRTDQNDEADKRDEKEDEPYGSM